MSDDNDSNLLLGLGLGYLLGKGSAERQARWEKEQKELKKELLKLDKQIAKDRGQTLEEYREWCEQQAAERRADEEAKARPSTLMVTFAVLFWGAYITLLVIYPAQVIVLSIAAFLLFVMIGFLLALVI